MFECPSASASAKQYYASFLPEQELAHGKDGEDGESSVTSSGTSRVCHNKTGEDGNGKDIAPAVFGAVKAADAEATVVAREEGVEAPAMERSGTPEQLSMAQNPIMALIQSCGMLQREEAPKMQEM